MPAFALGRAIIGMHYYIFDGISIYLTILRAPTKGIIKESMIGGIIIFLSFRESAYETNSSIAVANYFLFGKHYSIATIFIMLSTFPIF